MVLELGDQTVSQQKYFWSFLLPVTFLKYTPFPLPSCHIKASLFLSFRDKCKWKQNSHIPWLPFINHFLPIIILPFKVPRLGWKIISKGTLFNNFSWNENSIDLKNTRHADLNKDTSSAFAWISPPACGHSQQSEYFRRAYWGSI